MDQTKTFGEILEAVDQLPLEEQEMLVSVLRRRLAERGRERLISEIKEARQGFAEGGCRPVTPDELMDELLS